MTKSKKILSIVLISIISLAAIGGIVTGIVIGVKTTPTSGIVTVDGTDTPLADVVVTDGKNVTKTNENGEFELKGWLKNRFVTVTCPEGYWTDNYYIDMTEKPENYNFSLKKTKDQSEHSFLHISDTEVGLDGLSDTYLDYLEGVALDTDAAFVIQTGDICYENGLKGHYESLNSDNFVIPVRYTMGNHDYVRYGKYSEQLFEEIYGPVWYSFDVGKVHYVVAPMLSYKDNPTFEKYSNANFYTWLKNDLEYVAEDKSVVLFSHDIAKDEETFKIGGIDLKDNGLIAWAFGHWHQNFVNDIDGVLTISTNKSNGAGIDSTPAAVREVAIKNDKIDHTYLHYYDFDREDVQVTNAWTTRPNKEGGRNLYGSPLVDNSGNIYIATMTDDWPSKNYAYCYDKNGNEVWKSAELGNSVKNDMVLEDGKLYLQNSEGIVYCLDAQNGNEIWKFDCKLKYTKYTLSGMTYDNGKIYCGSSRDVFCLDAANGNVSWKKNGSGEVSPVKFFIEDDLLVVGKHWRKVIAYDKNTGKEQWSYKVGSASATAFSSDSKIYYPSSNSILQFDKKGSVSNADKTYTFTDKETTFKYNFDTASQGYVSNDIAYIGTVNNGVVAIDLKTMELTDWHVSVGKSIIYTSQYSSERNDNGRGCYTVDSSIVEKDGILYFGANDGYVYAVDKTDSTKITKYHIGSPVLSRVAFSGENLIVFDFSGNLTAIKI